MTTLPEIRKKFPQYDDLSDDDLASAIHEKFYADIPREQFDQQIGLPPKSYVERLWNKAGGIVSDARTSINGKQDPATADLPVYEATGLPQIARQNAAKATTFTDEGYGNVLAEGLGDRFIAMEKDANGYPIIRYRDDNGNETRAYVNRPGLDVQDVDRGVMAALPYVVSGGVVGKVVQKAPTVVRAAGQALTGAGTSVAQDVAANKLGSKEDIDPVRAGFAAGGSAAAELVAPIYTAGKQWIQGGRQYIDKATGNLTDDAARIAREAGIDPADLDADMAKAFAEGLNIGRDPKEIAAWIKTNRFGIPTTKATRTKDPELSAIEKDIRAGNLGQEAKGVLQQFDAEKNRAIERSAFNRTPQRDPNSPVSPYEDGVGAMVAPTRSDVGPAGVTPGNLGRDIQSTLKSARDRGEDAISTAYEGVSNLVANDAGKALLPQVLNNKLGSIRLNAQTPTALAMVEDIKGFAGGKVAQSEAADYIGQTPVATIHDQQKALLGIYRGAQTPADKAASKAVYEGFQDWIDEVAKQGFLSEGDAAAAAALRTARTVTREIKGLFDPRGRNIDPAASKILKEIVDRDNNADGIVAMLFGGGGPQTVPKKGAIDAIEHIKKILADSRLVDADEGARTLNDIRMAYWSRLALSNKGGMNTPQMFADNIRKATVNQRGLMNALFSPAEQKVFREYAAALEAAAFKDPNPSGTATALRSLMKNDGSWIKTLLQMQSKRELFSKHNVFMSRVYQLLAQKVPADILGSKNAAGTAAARAAISQNLTKKPAETLGGYGGAAGSQYGGSNE